MSIRFQRVDSSDKTLLEFAYRLRFVVYCVESGFEDPDWYPAGLERDEYDQHSIHFVALNNTGIIGTVRLILNGEAGFPMERHCRVNPRAKKFPRHQIAEISRLAVFRMWRCPAVTLGLMREVYRESKRLGIRFWYAAMEPKLARLLKKYHLRFNQVGPLVDYHGQRIPFIGNIEEIESYASAHDPNRFQYFAEGLEEGWYSWPSGTLSQMACQFSAR